MAPPSLTGSKGLESSKEWNSATMSGRSIEPQVESKITCVESAASVHQTAEAGVAGQMRTQIEGDMW